MWGYESVASLNKSGKIQNNWFQHKNKKPQEIRMTKTSIIKLNYLFISLTAQT